MKRNSSLLTVLTIIITAFPIASAAASTTGSVGSASVTKGQTAIEGRIGYSEADETSSQDERFRSRVQIDHGFTDYYAGRVVFSQDRRKGDNLEHDAIKFENRFYLLDKEDYGFDFGFRAAYSHKDGDKKPSSLEFGLYELIPLQNFELRLNQIFAHDVGEDAEDGVSGELRAQVTYPVFTDHRIGLEGFHDFGDLSDLNGWDTQSHTFGPVLKGKLGGNFKYETGYRAGISDAAPDHSFKFFIGRAF